MVSAAAASQCTTPGRHSDISDDSDDSSDSSSNGNASGIRLHQPQMPATWRAAWPYTDGRVCSNSLSTRHRRLHLHDPPNAIWLAGWRAGWRAGCAGMPDSNTAGLGHGLAGLSASAHGCWDGSLGQRRQPIPATLRCKTRNWPKCIWQLTDMLHATCPHCTMLRDTVPSERLAVRGLSLSRSLSLPICLSAHLPACLWLAIGVALTLPCDNCPTVFNATHLAPRILHLVPLTVLDRHSSHQLHHQRLPGRVHSHCVCCRSDLYLSVFLSLCRTVWQLAVVCSCASGCTRARL
ncbi:hypothetical protein BC831DRAFT_206166 [Entophlyctis helioformis]|nr:hypothetical protein BC831DRAFT_206166 [Entophlyctis helioformis]